MFGLDLAAAAVALGTTVASWMGGQLPPTTDFGPCTGRIIEVYATDDPDSYGPSCDLRPPQTLTVIFDEVSWGDHETWGSDASLAWADGECADIGGTPVWDSGNWMQCVDVDY